MWTTLLCVLGLGLSAADKTELSPSQQAAVAESLRPAIVRVEYGLQYDKGEAPAAAGWVRRCPNCGQYHVDDTAQRVAEERPLEVGGFLLSPNRVIAPDVLIHPRFVKGITVRSGDQTRSARIAAYARDQKAVLLDLAEPLPDAKPLVFDEKVAPPYLGLTVSQENGTWAIGIQPVSMRVTLAEAGWRFAAVPSNCLILGTSGKAVGMSMCDEVPLDDSWKGSPAGWPTLDAEALARSLDTVGKRCDQALPRVSLQFRSPRNKPENRWSYRSYSDDEDDPSATRREVLGLLLDDRMVLVLAELRPKTTARLEQVLVHAGDGGPVPAQFVCSLADFGGFLAAMERPLPAAMPVADQPILGLRNRLLLSAQVSVKGEQRSAYYQHARISSFEHGWHGRPYPSLTTDVAGVFLFDPEGKLLALPISRRKKVTVREEWDNNRPLLTPVAYLAAAVADAQRRADPTNIPLTEEQENRLAWMGVELQPLTKELARLNKVSDMTRDGETGALVTFVYPDSPAARAGIEAGHVLLRLHTPDQPRPLEVKVENERMGMDSFPWDQLDAADLSAELLAQLPTPWPSAANSFTTALTELGFGTKYRADFWHEGKLVSKDFEVVQSPPHFDSAPRFKCEPLGLTVRDLTYEVRRHFQMEAAEPGVVISKLEPGSKAAVAGILPYERITQVNDAPVASVKEFEKAVATGGEIRLSVKRQTQGRIVKITLPKKG